MMHAGQRRWVKNGSCLSGRCVGRQQLTGEHAPCMLRCGNWVWVRASFESARHSAGARRGNQLVPARANGRAQAAVRLLRCKADLERCKAERDLLVRRVSRRRCGRHVSDAGHHNVCQADLDRLDDIGSRPPLGDDRFRRVLAGDEQRKQLGAGLPNRQGGKWGMQRQVSRWGLERTSGTCCTGAEAASTAACLLLRLWAALLRQLDQRHVLRQFPSQNHRPSWHSLGPLASAL